MLKDKTNEELRDIILSARPDSRRSKVALHTLIERRQHMYAELRRVQGPEPIEHVIDRQGAIEKASTTLSSHSQTAHIYQRPRFAPGSAMIGFFAGLVMALLVVVIIGLGL